MSGIVKPQVLATLNRSDPLAYQLVGYWPMLEGSGGTAHDYSVRQNHGTLTGMDPPTDWGGSQSGWALDLDGSNDYVSVPSEPIQIGLSDLTIMCWCFSRDTSGNYTFVDQRNTSAPYTGFVFLLDALGTYDLSIELNGATRVQHKLADPPAQAYDLEWHCWIVSIVRAGTAIAYCDGEIIGSTGLAASTTQNILGSNPVKIGGHHTNNSAWVYNGLFGAAALWHRALLENEVKRLSADPFCLLRPVANPAWWYEPTGGNTYTHSVTAPFALAPLQSASAQYTQAGAVPAAAVPGQTVSGQYPVSGAVPAAAVSDQAALAQYVTASLAPLSAVTDQAATAAYLAGVSARLACTVEDLISAVYRETGIIPAALLPSEVASALYAVAPAVAMGIEPGASAAATYSASDLVRLSLITDQHISIPGLGRGWLLRVLQSGRYS